MTSDDGARVLTDPVCPQLAGLFLDSDPLSDSGCGSSVRVAEAATAAVAAAEDVTTGAAVDDANNGGGGLARGGGSRKTGGGTTAPVPEPVSHREQPIPVARFGWRTPAGSIVVVVPGPPLVCIGSFDPLPHSGCANVG